MVSTSTSPARTPVRTCIGCRERAAKRELLRVVRGADRDGRPAAVPDPSGTAPGRGAHLHPTPECYELAVRRRAFARALRVPDGLTGAPVGDYLVSRAHTTDRQELEQ
ncbi:YlxR family protein [Nocardioides coralli]|nr:YlxR family protein [Nocardioides coralli]QZY28087.1 YlxR family protein [Nocardioides coralli]